METRGNRPNYLALNDGYQSEVRPEDWTSSLAWSPAAQGPEETVPSSPPPFRSQLAFNANIDSFDEAFDVVLPSESASQLPTRATSSQGSTLNLRQNNWMWDHLHIREFPNEWTEKRSNRKRLIDREIYCTVV
jgi:hypothetical protein